MNLEKEYYYKVKIEKRWSDLDELGVVNNATIMTYLEEARIRFFIEALQWEWKDTGLVVANATINYRTPITYHDHPVIYIKCTKVGTKSFTLQYTMAEMALEAVKVFSEAQTTLVCYDFAQKVSVAIPEYIRERFYKLDEDHKRKHDV